MNKNEGATLGIFLNKNIKFMANLGKWSFCIFISVAPQETEEYMWICLMEFCLNFLCLLDEAAASGPKASPGALREGSVKTIES